ncbi:ferredoxin [Amycolatopsis pithecellobii]|uniref:Ferredoxin n=1 Tax=Amycolatopsis pithecellobii TaxID=664692 RepID=A0A6N7ZAU2_9PSEU|nr:ferredoxin [Amycolatopsis pithecellobii]MTD58850.1 ferredoxin [Amycolatopsis pithecellobii]
MIDVDPGVCVGAGQCVQAAPASFDQDEETGLVVLLEAAGRVDEAAVLDAVALCPSGALRLSDRAGRR